MIRVCIFDFSRVLLHPRQREIQSINTLHAQLRESQEYAVLNHFELNEELLHFIEGIKVSLPVYIFTSGVIHNEPAIDQRIQQLFTKIYTAEELDVSKKDPSAYVLLLKLVNATPTEVLFIDDSEENVQAAKQAGLQTIVYQSNTQLFQEMAKFMFDFSQLS